MTTDAGAGSPTNGPPERYKSIVETIGDGVIVFDTDGTITFVNDAVAEFTGRSRDDIVGASLASLTEWGLFGDTESERLADAIAPLCAGVERERRLTVETGESDDRVLEVRLGANHCEDGVTEVVGIVRDVSERERALETVERKRDALQRLYEINTNSGLTAEERVRRVLDLGCEYLDLPYGFLTTVDGGRQQLVHVVGDSEKLHAGGSVQLDESYCRQTVDSDGLIALQNVPAELGADNPAYSRFGMSCYIGTKVLVGNDELYGTFCFAADDAREQSFNSTEQQFVKLLGQWAGYTVERRRYEDRLRGLNDVAGELLRAETMSGVAAVGVETCADLLDLPVTACLRYDEIDDTLRPLAETEHYLAVVGETPTFERGDTLVWESFDADELRVYDDRNSEAVAYDRESAVHSEAHVPLGSHGLLISGTTEQRGFSDSDVESLRLLGQLIESALVAVKRREAIAERGAAIQRQNEQLEEFSRVVAHDLRNPLAGAVGFLEIARETHAESHFDRVEGSLNRMETLIDELLDIARGRRQPTDTREIPLETPVREAWSYLDTPAATLVVDGELGRLEADETRLLQLLANLFRNAVEHVGNGVTVTVGRLSDGTGFYVENDGPSFPEAARREVLQYGRTSSKTGTGIGMMSVTDIAGAHGWAFDITEADGGGARFEFDVAGSDR